MNSSWSASISKLMIWCNNHWQKYETNNTMLTLRMVYDLLLITTETKVLESLNTRSKIKGIYKEDILILIISNVPHEIRKIKFQINGNVRECFQNLGQHFPVVNHKVSNSDNIYQCSLRNIDEILKEAIEKIETGDGISLPPEYSRFVKLCLLDPNMRQIVHETQKVLNNLK